MEMKEVLELIKDLPLQKTSGSHDENNDYTNFVGLYEGPSGVKFSHYIIFISDYRCNRDSEIFTNVTVKDIIKEDDDFEFTYTKEMRFVHFKFDPLPS